ncbi:hypothetical protein PybrP1_004788 [[Pythium] brassicae (nom. inval.)]|nr:hypothetical protein PybrP1_004788 [[Pythium] brassicae (nom. inval.)]
MPDSDEDATALSSAIVALLVQHATTARREKLEYVAELVCDTAEDGADLEAEALDAALTETLEDAALPLAAADVALLVQQLVALLRPSVASAEDEKARRRAAHEAALRAQFAAGKQCLAVLEEDNAWHPAEIVQQVSDEDADANAKKTSRAAHRRRAPFRLEIEFVEFGKKVVVRMEDMVLDEDRADRDDDPDGTGLCEMCERPMNLTAHHLIPRTTHAQYRKKGYTKEFLNTCVMICRQCHSKIHSVEDERTLARDFSTLEKIMAHPEIVRWVAYASKQKARIRPTKKSKYPVGK